MKVFVHIRKNAEGPIENIPIEFEQVPAIGEHFVLDSASSWYECRLVVHVPKAVKGYDAEIYAIPVDRHKLVRPFTAMGSNESLILFET